MVKEQGRAEKAHKRSLQEIISRGILENILEI